MNNYYRGGGNYPEENYYRGRNYPGEKLSGEKLSQSTRIIFAKLNSR